MSVTLGLLLTQHNARARRDPDPRVGLVLLERTLLDPPRAAAAKRWGDQIRRAFPAAELIPYAWHLLSHGPDERMAERTTRTIAGPAHSFGGLQDNPQTRQAWEVTQLCMEAMGSTSVAVRTPPSLTPGALGRARFRAFVEARRAEGTRVIWESEGLWEAPVAAAFASELEVPLLLPAFAGGRALRNEDLGGLAVPGAWLRVDGSGPRQGIHGGIIDDLLDHADTADQTVLVFAGPRAHNNLALVAEALL
ncbi:hypothetical protein [Paraliomyxa miuraensis]|uniref:hypothetical protein n=1 Tax=Paraliomyxa miuraensis TaxID=376150 RepID=UPI00225A8B12|nr:hypothetical protein [Paraliomyxa miuraensis]MCX4244290.1 hypothetical protein [Paraliomyxa miuraensis]